MIDLSQIPHAKNLSKTGLLKIATESGHIDSVSQFLKDHIDGVWLLDIVGVDQSLQNKGVELHYHFSDVENDELITVTVSEAKKDTVKSISHIFFNSSLYEQELNEFFGVQFDKTYRNEIFGAENKIYPLLKDELRKPEVKKEPFDEYSFQKNLFLNEYQIEIKTAEENNLISQCEVNLGYGHIGLEKISENLNLFETYQLLENVFSTQSLDWSFLLSHNIEKSKKMIIPERAQALRMVCLEFSRIFSHLMYLRNLNFYYQNDSFYHHSLLWMKRLQALFISLCGNEALKNIIRIGGVIKDVNQAWLSRTIDDLLILEKEIEQFEKFFTEHRHWRESLNISLFDKQNAALYCLTGPMVRASGINIDFRKSAPFYFYKDVRFEVPVATNGTAFDLVCIKIVEIKESINIILQVLDNLPTGSCMNDEYLDFTQIQTTQHEGNEDAFKAKLKTIFSEQTSLTHFSYIESANGILSLYLDMQEGHVDRLHLGSSDLLLKKVFEEVSIGKDMSELETLWHVLQPNLKYIER
ncbi:MAG: hypothetical protein CME62_17845 [Halobacteriovoraceae bacterium]|nr:hypothetical protein [Halobacteriovoraceae bacterium]